MRQLEPLRRRGHRLAVVVDPERLVAPIDLAPHGAAYVCDDWLTLRRAYELHGRAPAAGARPILLVHDHAVSSARDLPWDIEQRSLVVTVGWPVHAELRGLLRELEPPLADLLIRLAKNGTTDGITSTLLRDGFGVVLPAATPSDELNAVARLRTDATVPDGLWSRVRPLLRDPLALALAESPPNASTLQDAWKGWLRNGDDAPYASTLAAAAPAVVALLTAGLLHPAPKTASGLPAWVSVGAAAPDPEEHLEQLVAHPPLVAAPASAGEWAATAAWWGDVRAALSEVTTPSDQVAAAWELWHRLDGAFGTWLRAEYGRLLTRHAALPLTVNQIADFLRRRVTGDDRRVLLVAMDGMAFAQWSILRRELSVDAITATGCFAMCPTLTSVSRQAIFAGGWPADFADTLWTTARERQRWSTFWQNAGLAGSEVAWLSTRGRDASEVPRLPVARAVGLVVLAVDELLHGSDVNGDAQVGAGVRTWARFGFLQKLIEDASMQGFEVWITADHGNIEAVPSGRIMEGLRVDHAGTRARIYESAALRDAARADGIAWDPPGHPIGGKVFLFAPGRSGYHSGGIKVTHGGLSFDEVIVPLVQVVPR